MKSIITISRQYGSGGHDLAVELAKRLEIPFYDRDLIRLAAEKSGISPEQVERNEEEKPSTLLMGISVPDFYSGGIVNMQPLTDRVFLCQAEIIKELSDKGACVIVGRAADYILRERRDVLRVFIHASEQARLERIATRHSDFNEKKLLKRMETIDKQRAQHCRHYTDQVWGESKNYDLCLRSDACSFDGCVDILTAAYRAD